MRSHAIAVLGVAFAGLFGAVPTAAQAASAAPAADEVEHITCTNNAKHYTASDIYLNEDLQIDKVVWNTVAAYHPDRITWSAWDETTQTYVLVGAVGGSSSSLDDVAPSGTSVQRFAQVANPLGWRMTVFDAAMGNCQGYSS
jgi:hypothetical protein